MSARSPLWAATKGLNDVAKKTLAFLNKKKKGTASGPKSAAPFAFGGKKKSWGPR
jgi:hypothetical protein